MSKITRLENYIISEEHITHVERMSDSTIRIYFVNGQTIELFNDEANKFWSSWDRDNAE